MVEDRWVHAATAKRLTNIKFSFDPCNIYRDGPRGDVGYPADAHSVGDSHPSCFHQDPTSWAIHECRENKKNGLLMMLIEMFVDLLFSLLEQ